MASPAPTAAESPAGRSKLPLLLGAVVLAVAGILGLCGYFAFGGSDEGQLGGLLGLKLGDSPSLARKHFRPPNPPGGYRVFTSPEMRLVWTPRQPQGDLHRAQLEFHDGMLVAMRLNVTPNSKLAQGPELAKSDTAVLTRKRTGSGVSIRLISRACPTHAKEVRRILAQSPLRGR